MRRELLGKVVIGLLSMLLLPSVLLADSHMERFTLSCTGTASGDMAEKIPAYGGAFAFILSFEINGPEGRYFDFSESKWHDIVKVTAQELTLEDVRQLPLDYFQSIDRISGHYVGTWTGNPKSRRPNEVLYLKEGTCEKVAWKAPPAAKF